MSILALTACSDAAPDQPPVEQNQTVGTPTPTPEPAPTPEPTPEPEPDIIVTFTGMTSLPSDTGARRFRDWVGFEITVQNNVDQYIRGIQGAVDIQDMFGVQILRVSLDLVALLSAMW